MLKQKLQQEQIKALKTKDTKKLNILRYLLSVIKNKEIDQKGALSDEEIINIIRKQVKELKEAISSSKKAHRQDLLKENQKQLEIIQSYLPAELSDQELKEEIEKIINQNQELSTQNPKALIGICVKLLKSKASPSRIVQVLQSIENQTTD